MAGFQPRLLLALAACSAAMSAQAPAGALQGRVAARGAGPLGGAEVTARDPASGLARTVRTDPRGDYAFQALPAGAWLVSVRAAGLKAPVGLFVQVEPGRASTANFTLDPREAGASVAVTAAAEEGAFPASATLAGDDLAALRAASPDTAGLLRDLPGMSLLGAGGVSSLPAIRGLADDRVRVKVDGMDLVSSCPNHMNPPLSCLDPASVGSARVYAGIAPVSLGGDSTGGAILVDAPPPRFAAPGQGTLLEGRAGAAYRSNGRGSGFHLAATAAGEALSVTYRGSLAQSGDYAAAGAFKPAGPAASDRGWLPGDVVGSTRYRAWNHALDTALRLDGHLLELKLGRQDIPYEGFPNQRMDLTSNLSTHVNLRYLGRMSWGSLEARAYQEHTEHRMDFGPDKQYLYGSPATFVAPGMPMDTDGRNRGAFIKASLPLPSGHLLRLGAEAQDDRLDDRWPPSPSALPAGVALGGMAPNTFVDLNNGRRDRLDAFLEWEAAWTPRWTTQAGIRASRVTMDAGPVQGYNAAMYDAAPAYPATTFNASPRAKLDHNWDATFQVRYAPCPGQSYAFGAARKTRSPSLYERYAWSQSPMAMEMVNFAGDGNAYVGNLGLKLEVARTLSADAAWSDPAGERWEVKLSPHVTQVQDFIDVRRFPGPGAAMAAALSARTGFVYLQYWNQDARIYGADLSGRLVLSEGTSAGRITATAAASQLRGENRTTGDNLYDIMPLNARAGLAQERGGWKGALEAQWVDAKTRVSQVRDEVPTGGYALFNLRCAYLWKQVRFDIAVENLLDKFYAPPLGGAYLGQGRTMAFTGVPWGVPVPGMGRSVNAGVELRF